MQSFVFAKCSLSTWFLSIKSTIFNFHFSFVLFLLVGILNIYSNWRDHIPSMEWFSKINIFPILIDCNESIQESLSFVDYNLWRKKSYLNLLIDCLLGQTFDMDLEINKKKRHYLKRIITFWSKFEEIDKLRWL